MSIDLAQLPASSVIETLSFEDVYSAIKSDFLTRSPEHADVINLESEPAVKLLQSAAYTVLHLRNRVNHAAKSVLLATATGTNLDNIGALFNVQRALITAADTDAVPPVAAVYETDNRFRSRIQQALEGFTSAGTVGAYKFHTLAVGTEIADVAVTSAVPGNVEITISSTAATGVASAELIAKVATAMETVRPLCDNVTVNSASLLQFTVNANITVLPGPDSTVVHNAAKAALNTYLATQKKLGATVALSGIYAALHQAGVENVTITSPTADIVATATQVPLCTSSTVTVATHA